MEGLSAGSMDSIQHGEDLPLLPGTQGCSPGAAAAAVIQHRLAELLQGRAGCLLLPLTSQCQAFPAQRSGRGRAGELGMLFSACTAQGQAGPAPTPTMARQDAAEGAREDAAINFSETRKSSLSVTGEKARAKGTKVHQ